MTAQNVRETNGNIRLAWMISEDEIPVSEVSRFTKDELVSVYSIIFRKDLRCEADTILKLRHLTHLNEKRI